MQRLQAFKYKLKPDGFLIAVPAQNTSCTCPECRHVVEGNRPTSPVCVCEMRNADRVGALNVLRAGHARLACEVSGAVRPPAAGTQLSDSFCHAGMGAVGIPRL